MKKISLVLLICATLGLTACAKSGTTAENTLTVGMECNYPPFNWSQLTKTDTSVAIDGQSGSYCDGYDVQVAKLIAEKLNRTLVIKALDWSVLVNASSLNDGTIDLIIAGMNPTPERAQSIDFSNEYYRSEYVMIVQKSGKYANATSLNDFSGAKIVTQINTFNDTLIDQINGVNHANPVDTFPLAITDLANNNSDGVVAELPIAESAVAANSSLTYIRFAQGSGFTVLDTDVATAVGVKKGNTDLLNQVNEVLAALDSDQRNTMMLEAINRQP